QDCRRAGCRPTHRSRPRTELRRQLVLLRTTLVEAPRSDSALVECLNTEAALESRGGAGFDDVSYRAAWPRPVGILDCVSQDMADVNLGDGDSVAALRDVPNLLHPSPQRPLIDRLSAPGASR